MNYKDLEYKKKGFFYKFFSIIARPFYKEGGYYYE